VNRGHHVVCTLLKGGYARLRNHARFGRHNDWTTWFSSAEIDESLQTPSLKHAMKKGSVCVIQALVESFIASSYSTNTSFLIAEHDEAAGLLMRL